MCCNPLRMGMISSRHDVLSRTSRTGGQSNRRWGSKAIRIGHSLEDSSLRMRTTALSAEILLGSPKTSRSISERNSRKIRLRCIFRRTLASEVDSHIIGACGQSTELETEAGVAREETITRIAFTDRRGGDLQSPGGKAAELRRHRTGNDGFGGHGDVLKRVPAG